MICAYEKNCHNYNSILSESDKKISQNKECQKKVENRVLLRMVYQHLVFYMFLCKYSYNILLNTYLNLKIA